MKIVYEKFRRQHNTQKHKWHHAEHWWNKNRRLQFKREIELASFYAVLLLLSQIARCLTFSFPFLSCSRFNMSQMAIKVHNDYYCCYFDGEYDVCFRMLHSTGSSFLPSSHCDVAEQFWRKFLCFTHVTVIKMFLVVADVVDVVDAAAKAINKKIRSQHSAIFLLLQLRFLSYHSIINFFLGCLRLSSSIAEKDIGISTEGNTMKAIFCHWKGNESHHKTEHSQKSIRKLEANAPIPFPFVFFLCHLFRPIVAANPLPVKKRGSSFFISCSFSMWLNVLCHLCRRLANTLDTNIIHFDCDAAPFFLGLTQ